MELRVKSELCEQCLGLIKNNKEKYKKEEKNIKAYMNRIGEEFKKSEITQAMLCDYINIEPGVLSEFIGHNDRKHKVPLRYAFWFAIAFAESYDDARVLMGMSGNRLTGDTEALLVAEAIFRVYCDLKIETKRKLKIVYAVMVDNDLFFFF